MKNILGTLSCVVSITLLTITAHWATAAPPLQVTAADPSSTTQGTLSLNVTVSGNGFDSSAVVEFFVTGSTNPGGITVKNVKVTGSKKLIATIDVADAASIANFDIQVTQSGGRKGKGTSLFRVLAKVSNDPCDAADIDFPAFTFRESDSTGPQDTQQVYAADATGKCVRPVHKIVGFGSDAMSTVFSYPVAGTADVGRIVWVTSDKNIYGVSFSVSGTSVTPYPMELIYTGGDGEIMAANLSKDGSTVYASLRTRVPPETTRIVAINYSDHSYATVYGPTGPSEYISEITVDESGVLFVKLAPPPPALRQILRIDPGCTNASCAVVIAHDIERGVDQVSGPAASLSDNRVVYEHDGLISINNCRRLQVVSKDGGPVLDSAQPMYGTRSTWYGGKILTNGTAFPRKHGFACGQTGKISQFDPETGVETVLVEGYDPDGR